MPPGRLSDDGLAGHTQGVHGCPADVVENMPEQRDEHVALVSLHVLRSRSGFGTACDVAEAELEERAHAR